MTTLDIDLNKMTKRRSFTKEEWDAIQRKKRRERRENLYNYDLVHDMLLHEGLSEVDAYTFYRDLFPVGSMERLHHPEDEKPNMMITIIRQEKTKGHTKTKDERSWHEIIFDEFKNSNDMSIEEFTDNYDLVVTSPVLYSGKRKNRFNAYLLYGFCIDLDNVKPHNARDLIHQMETEQLPKATYIALSGTGLHVYYFFDVPVELYPYRYGALTLLKKTLTDVVWNKYTSSAENKQFQGIVQGFRMIGSKTKLWDEEHDCRVRAYKYGPKHYVEDLFAWTLQLKSWSRKEYAKLKKTYDSFSIRALSLAEAKETYPDWYQNRIIEKKPMKGFAVSRAVYDNWLQRVIHESYDGNRYHAVCMLFVYGVKCDVPLEEVKRDALAIVPLLDEKTKEETNHFTEQDVLDAQKYYDNQYKKMRVDTIQNISGLQIERQKRNRRPQKQHLEIARAIRDTIHTDWREGAGRPDKAEIVQEWRLQHPNGTKAQCKRETGLAKATVYKWWDS